MSSPRPPAALALVERLELNRYHYLHATRAELLRRLDRVDDARAAYDRALESSPGGGLTRHWSVVPPQWRGPLQRTRSTAA